MKDLADKLRAAQALSKAAFLNKAKPKKGDGVMVTIGMAKKPSLSDEPEMEEEDASMEEESDEVALAKEIIGALKEDDAEGLASALRAFMENC